MTLEKESEEQAEGVSCDDVQKPELYSASPQTMSRTQVLQTRLASWSPSESPILDYQYLQRVFRGCWSFSGLVFET